MNINKIKIKNYRLLKDFEIELEEKLSLVIGKNNCGKTSLLSILEKFIGEKSKKDLSFDDFNIDFKDELKTLIEKNFVDEKDFPFIGTSLKLFITYDERDDLSNISNIMMDLNPDNKTVVLAFEYKLTHDKFKKLKVDFKEFEEKEKTKWLSKLTALKSEESEIANEETPSEEVNEVKEVVATADKVVALAENVLAEANEVVAVAEEILAGSTYRKKDICYFLRTNIKDYFDKFEKAIEYNIDDPNNPFENDDNFIDLNKEKVQLNKIINFKLISAKRDVSNKEPDKSLSSLSSLIYKKTEANEKELKAIENFKDALSDTDLQLDGIYSNLFEAVINKVAKFGGIKPGDSIIEIISSLHDRELLEGNTTVMYKHNDKGSLPENYNGLGYMNLISMIFEIEILLQEFKKEKFEKPADINLLFIEEPEAHTHPQMQYVFIKNIKSLLGNGIEREDGNNRKLQTIISTHSSHIVSESDFDDIKYFKRENKEVKAKNLKGLIKDYAVDPKQYEFLKQYLTISRAELFFADKAILIEGDTERILLPTIMKKMDVEEEEKFKSSSTIDPYLPLLSQNISIVEVGAYSQIFEKFIDFLGIKSLIITDLDTTDADGKACKVSDGVDYSNTALSFFLNAPTLQALKDYLITDKTLKKNTTWVVDADGSLCIVYQTSEGSYNARSFEDAFIHLNRDFVSANKANFKGIKNPRYFDDPTKDAYFLADECINKKTHFALDILYYSDETFSNWQIPCYIKEGLQWLKKN